MNERDPLRTSLALTTVAHVVIGIQDPLAQAGLELRRLVVPLLIHLLLQYFLVEVHVQLLTKGGQSWGEVGDIESDCHPLFSLVPI